MWQKIRRDSIFNRLPTRIETLFCTARRVFKDGCLRHDRIKTSSTRSMIPKKKRLKSFHFSSGFPESLYFYCSSCLNINSLNTFSTRRQFFFILVNIRSALFCLFSWEGIKYNVSQQINGRNLLGDKSGNYLFSLTLLFDARAMKNCSGLFVY